MKTHPSSGGAVAGLALGLLGVRFASAQFLFPDKTWATHLLWAIATARNDAVLLLVALLAWIALSFWTRHAFWRAAFGAAAILVVAVSAMSSELLATIGLPLSRDLLAVGVSQALLFARAGVELRTHAFWAFLAALVFGALFAFARRRGFETRPVAGVVVLFVGALFLTSENPRDNRTRYRASLLTRLSPVEAFRVASEMARPKEPAKEADLACKGPALPSGLAPIAGSKPDIVLLVLESVGARYLRSFHPLGVADTPEIDRLTQDHAVVFDRAFAESPLTVQSAWSLLHGMSPPSKPFGFLVSDKLPRGPAPLQQVLSAAGYQTGQFQSGNLGMWNTERIANVPPFARFEDARSLGKRPGALSVGWGVEDRVTVDVALDWLRKTDPARPVFSLIWTIESHYPHTWPNMPDELKTPARQIDRYRHTIEQADAIVGRVRAFLESRPQSRPWVLVVVGDHGTGTGRARPWDYSHSGLVFEDEIHVPLIVYSPLLGRTSHVATPVSLPDLYPTLSEFASIAPPGDIDGRSLARSVAPRPIFARSIVFWPAMIRCGSHKFLIEEANEPGSFYDIDHDPLEQTDLSGSRMDLAAPMKTALLRVQYDLYRNDPYFRYGRDLLPRFIADEKSAEWKPR